MQPAGSVDAQMTELIRLVRAVLVLERRPLDRVVRWPSAGAVWLLVGVVPQGIRLARAINRLHRGWASETALDAGAVATECTAVVDRMGALSMAPWAPEGDCQLAVWRVDSSAAIEATIRWVRAGQPLDSPYGRLVEPAYQALQQVDATAADVAGPAEQALDTAWQEFLAQVG